MYVCRCVGVYVYGVGLKFLRRPGAVSWRSFGGLECLGLVWNWSWQVLRGRCEPQFHCIYLNKYFTGVRTFHVYCKASNLDLHTF